MNSQRSPSQILIWNSENDRFDIVSPDTSTITCIGITSSGKKKKCTNRIHQSRIADAVTTTRKLLHPTNPINNNTGRLELFSQLAKATLCKQTHQHQSVDLAERWTRVFERGLPRARSLPSGTQVYDHVSGGGSGGGIKGEHQQHTGAQEQEQTHRRACDKRPCEEQETPPRAKRRRHCDLPGASDQEEEESGEQAEGARQSRFDAEARQRSDQANREEAKRQSQREKKERQAHQDETNRQAQQAETERAAAAERVRLQLETKRIAELQAEQQRREGDRADLTKEVRAEKEREDGLRVAAKQRHERNAQQPWSEAWATFGVACRQLEDPKTRPAEISDLELYTVDFWPTRVGSYESCTEAAVREFFANPATVITRRIWVKLAWLWHPDRSMRHFSQSKHEEEIRGKVTMVTAVINNIIATF
jgi:hypothetical protein